jgi:putative membrane protein
MKLNKTFYPILGVLLVCLPTMMLGQSSNGNATPKHDASSQTSMKAGSNEQTSGSVPASDQKFLREAAEGGLAEVELGKLATEKGSSEEVKKFGQRMMEDHTKANDELKQLASSKGVNLPDQLSTKDRLLKEHLSKLSGPNFDRSYMENMVKDHKKDVADFARESNGAKDPDVKQFASKTLPTLKDHLKEAEGISHVKTASSKASSK